MPALVQPAEHDIEKPETESDGTVTPEGTVSTMTPSVGMAKVEAIENWYVASVAPSESLAVMVAVVESVVTLMVEIESPVTVASDCSYVA